MTYREAIRLQPGDEVGLRETGETATVLKATPKPARGHGQTGRRVPPYVLLELLVGANWMERDHLDVD